MLPYGPIAVRFRQLLRREDGASATEYAILLGLLVLIAMAAILSVGKHMQIIYDDIHQTIPG